MSSRVTASPDMLRAHRPHFGGPISADAVEQRIEITRWVEEQVAAVGRPCRVRRERSRMRAEPFVALCGIVPGCGGRGLNAVGDLDAVEPMLEWRCSPGTSVTGVCAAL